MADEIIPRSVSRTYRFNERLKWNVQFELRIGNTPIKRTYSLPEYLSALRYLKIYTNHGQYPFSTSQVYELEEPLLEKRWSWDDESINANPEDYPSTHWLYEEIEHLYISVYSSYTLRRVEAQEYVPPYDPNNPPPPNPPYQLMITTTDYDPLFNTQSSSSVIVQPPYNAAATGVMVTHSGNPVFDPANGQQLPSSTQFPSTRPALRITLPCVLEFRGRYEYSYPIPILRRDVEELIPVTQGPPPGWNLNVDFDPIAVYEF